MIEIDGEYFVDVFKEVKEWKKKQKVEYFEFVFSGYMPGYFDTLNKSSKEKLGMPWNDINKNKRKMDK